MNTKTVGKTSEESAVNYLIEQGYEILARNYYSQFGEIDIIAMKNNRISAIEVKYRKNPLVSVFNTIPKSKIKKLENTLYYYLSINNYTDKYDLGIDALLIEDINNRKNIYFIKNIQLNF